MKNKIKKHIVKILLLIKMEIYYGVGNIWCKINKDVCKIQYVNVNNANSTVYKIPSTDLARFRLFQVDQSPMY